MDPRKLTINITCIAARLEQFQQLLNTRAILILKFTRPYAITYTNVFYLYFINSGFEKTKTKNL